MIFIIFLVSLGTIHVILASEERHKRKHNRAVITPDSAAPADVSKVEETTGGVWALMRAVEEHGRGKEPENGAGERAGDCSSDAPASRVNC